MNEFDEILTLTNGPVSYELTNQGHMKLREHMYPWSIRKTEFNIMTNIITTYNLKRGYECATAFGVSSTAAGLGFKKTGGKLVTMDAYVEELFDNSMSYRGAGAVTYPLSDDYRSAKFLHQHFNLTETVFCEVGWSPTDTAKIISKHFSVDEKLDFVFIDGGHFSEQLLLDIDSFVPFLADKFVLMFHDVYDSIFNEDVRYKIQSLFGKQIEIIVPASSGTGDNMGIIVNM
jgi:predicted O-methyltransferase YrrM